MASIFSKIVKGEIPSYKVAENENFYALVPSGFKTCSYKTENEVYEFLFEFLNIDDCLS